MHSNRIRQSTSSLALARGGFSFIELMVVIVIIGLLATTATLATRHFLDRAKVTRARADIAVYKSALEAHYSEHGTYPSTSEGLSVLVGVYIDKLRIDPWRNPYQYMSPGTAGPYDIVCLGSDGREGGEGVAADVSSEDNDIVGRR